MAPDHAWPDPETRAQDLAPVAEEMVQRIRYEDPTALCRELLGGLDRWEEWAVICILAAQVDPNEEYDVRVGWVRYADALKRAAPIVWAADEQPIEDMTSAQITELIARMAARHRSDDEIAPLVGISANAVTKRRERAGIPPGLRRGQVRTARAGVA